jgi:hypothetical protein
MYKLDEIQSSLDVLCSSRTVILDLSRSMEDLVRAGNVKICFIDPTIDDNLLQCRGTRVPSPEWQVLVSQRDDRVTGIKFRVWHHVILTR